MKLYMYPEINSGTIRVNILKIKFGADSLPKIMFSDVSWSFVSWNSVRSCCIEVSKCSFSLSRACWRPISLSLRSAISSPAIEVTKYVVYTHYLAIIFSTKNSQKTSHSSPIRASYGMTFVSSKSDSEQHCIKFKTYEAWFSKNDFRTCHDNLNKNVKPITWWFRKLFHAGFKMFKMESQIQVNIGS